MPRVNGTADIAAARAAMPPPQPQQPAHFTRSPEASNMLPEQNRGTLAHVALPPYAMEAAAAQQLPGWRSAGGPVSELHSAAGQGVEGPNRGLDNAGQSAASVQPPPPPPPSSPPSPPPDPPAALDGAANSSPGHQWPPTQAPEGQTDGAEHMRTFQHEAGSARAQYWAMHRPPGAWDA
jgi:hypothetical protein